jgi:hypothetical protein
MKDTLRNHWKTVLRFAVVGFVVTAVFVAFEVLFDPSGHSIIAVLLCVVFCPPSLLSVPIIDAEIGTIATVVLRLRRKSTTRREEG